MSKKKKKNNAAAQPTTPQTTVSPPMNTAYRTVGMLVIIAAVYIVMQHFGLLNYLVMSSSADDGTDYGTLAIFIMGLTTSVHCVAMCGGINLSQCLGKLSDADGVNHKTPDIKRRGFSVIRPSVLYNAGRVISYTAIGFIVGALGSAFTLSSSTQGILRLAAGLFMFVMGINMLGLFPYLRRFTPRMPKFFADKIDASASQSKTPLVVGLLNGLMPCGPLQAAQLYALSTGNPFKGALVMMMFALGTAPLMFGLGTFGTAVGKKTSRKIMAAGAVIVAVLGLSMLSQGWHTFGQSSIRVSDQETIATAQSADTQFVRSELVPRSHYPSITVEVNRPVKWVITAPPGSINRCNDEIIIEEYGITHKFKYGENVITFTPRREGAFRYWCWMRMIPGTITVTGGGG